MILMDDVFYKITHTTPAEHYVAAYAEESSGVFTVPLVLWATLQAAFYRDPDRRLHFLPVPQDSEELNESKVVGLILLMDDGHLYCPEEDCNFLGYCLATNNADEIYGGRAKEYEAGQEAKKVAQAKKEA